MDDNHDLDCVWFKFYQNPLITLAIIMFLLKSPLFWLPEMTFILKQNNSIFSKIGIVQKILEVFLKIFELLSDGAIY